MSVNRNKESIALDLKAPADRAVFESLLATADVLVENFRPGTMEKLGYDWPTLHARFPKLVFTSVSGFGQTGPTAGARLRHGGAGDGRNHEPDRPPRRAADARGRLDRRPGRGPVCGHRHAGRIAAARAHRPGRQGRRGDARLPGRAARERDLAHGGRRPRAGAHRLAAPVDHALRRVPCFRRLVRDRGGQRRAVPAPVHGAGIAGTAGRRALRHQPRALPAPRGAEAVARRAPGVGDLRALAGAC